MTIARDWRIDLDEQSILASRGDGVARMVARPGGREAWNSALADARGSASPSAAWDFIPVEEIRHGRVVLEGGASLGGGPLASVVAGSEHLAVIFCTIGPRLEERCREHQRNGDTLAGMLLDSLGSWIVDRLRQEICCGLEEEARLAGLRVSTALSPGESEWGIEDQTTLFSLVDAGTIGVVLGPSFIMTPLKSLSLVMGRGRGPLGRDRRALGFLRAQRARLGAEGWPDHNEA